MQGSQQQLCFFHSRVNMTFPECEWSEQFCECHNVWIYQSGQFLQRRSLYKEQSSVTESNAQNYLNIFNISNPNNQIPVQNPNAFEEEKYQTQRMSFLDDQLCFSQLFSCLVEEKENANVIEDGEKQDPEVTRFREDLPYINESLLTNTGKRQGLVRLSYFSLFDHQIELVEEIRERIGLQF